MGKCKHTFALQRNTKGRKCALVTHFLHLEPCDDYFTHAFEDNLSLPLKLPLAQIVFIKLLFFSVGFNLSK